MTNCKDLADAQLAKANKFAVGADQRVQMITENSSNKSINISNSAESGIQSINDALETGNPIIVGVHYEFDKRTKSGNQINEGTTDHFIVVVGRGSDEQGNYFNFYDNATAHSDLGTSEQNKLYLNQDRTLRGTFRNHNYVVSQVRQNQ